MAIRQMCDADAVKDPSRKVEISEWYTRTEKRPIYLETTHEGLVLDVRLVLPEQRKRRRH